MAEKLELIGAWIAAIVILVSIVFFVTFMLDLVFHIVKEEPMPITQQWLDEETRCFYVGERVINCETVRAY